jgi:hypothetical protein
LRHFRKQFVAVVLAGALIFLCSGCGSSNPSDDLRKELRTVSSWIETTRQVGQAWQAGSVPSAYATRTFQTAALTLQQEAATIQSLPLAEAIKSDWLARIEQVQTTLGRASVAIKSKDQSGVAAAITELTTAKQALDSNLKSPSAQTPTP